MGDNETLAVNAPMGDAAQPKPKGRGFDMDKAMALLKVPEVQAGLLMTAVLLPMFWNLILRLPELWFDAESYYQHGPIVPLAAGYIIYKRWDRINATAPRPTWLPLLLLAPLLFLVAVAARTNMMGVASGSLIFVLILISWALFGGRWAWKMLPAPLFLSFALPFWNGLIDKYTLNLQILSTDGSYQFLKLLGMQPFRQGPTVIQLPKFSLNIAAECSGMKMTLAMIACVVFISLVANIKWWGKMLLAVLAIPLSVAMNSLRIGLIGVFGNEMGHEAGMWFHDYGSYGVLALSFYILYKVAQKLGWDA
ncbi:MAG: exosortase/archaeosortase family protein [Armatimonadetes bacterium]|nr:exosortase/archaeosortase family protein [Armatimonadota bacterium]